MAGSLSRALDGSVLRARTADKATKHFDTKAPAIEYATKISKNQGAELVVHNKDGRVANPNSFGKDPCPPKDKKS